MSTKRKVSITLDLGPTDEQVAELEEKTAAMLAAIDAEQSGERKRRETLKELSLDALKEKYSTLIEQTLQYSDESSFEVNMAHQAIYTFTLKPEFSFFESALANRFEGVSVTFEYQNETFSVSCRIE